MLRSLTQATFGMALWGSAGTSWRKGRRKRKQNKTKKPKKTQEIKSEFCQLNRSAPKPIGVWEWQKHNFTAYFIIYPCRRMEGRSSFIQLQKNAKKQKGWTPIPLDYAQNPIAKDFIIVIMMINTLNKSPSSSHIHKKKKKKKGF